MEIQPRLIWLDGQLLPPAEALVPVLSPTAQFGLNVFEGIRGYWSDDAQDVYLFRLGEHLERLMESCRLLGINSPYSIPEIQRIILDVLKANEYRCDVAVRVTLFVGGDEGTWHMSEPVSMFVAPINKPRRSLENTAGARACISTWERIDDRSLPPRTKSGANYINGRYAHLEAKAAGYDLPVLLDRRGKVSEGAGSCLMMVRNGVLSTPPTTASILDSITRNTLLSIATQAGIPCEVRDIDRTELYLADEVFLCGSAAEITPLVGLDRFTIGDGTIGAVSADLLKRYLDAATGADAEDRGWLTPTWGVQNA